MNNKYDRDSTHDEMKSNGYFMTGEGLWASKELFSDEELAELGEISFEDMKPNKSVKLVLLKNGDLLLTELVESTYGEEVTLIDPKMVISRSSATSDGNVTTTIQYSQWMSLSAERKFKVNKNFIATVTEPIQSLYDSYLEGDF